MPYCHKCGKQLPEKASFCPFCGEKTLETPSSPAPASSSLSGPASSGPEMTAVPNPVKTPDKNGQLFKQMNLSLNNILFGCVALLVASIAKMTGSGISWVSTVFMVIGIFFIGYGIVNFFISSHKHVFSEEEMPQYAKEGQPACSSTEANALPWKAKMGLAYRKTSTIVWTVVAAIGIVGSGSVAIIGLSAGQIIGYYSGNGTVGPLGDWRSYEIKLELDGTVLRYQHIIANGYETTVAGTGSWKYQFSELTITLDPAWEKMAFEKDETTYVRSSTSSGIFWNLKGDSESSTYCWYGPSSEPTYNIKD